MQKQTPQDLLLLAEPISFCKYCIRIHANGIYAFALAGRICGGQQTQGDALGYALAGLSARSLNACQLQVNT